VSGLKITKMVLLDEEKPVELEKLNRLMAVFCSALRFSFNRLVEGEKEGTSLKRYMRFFI
jgi:hypothetical protein